MADTNFQPVSLVPCLKTLFVSSCPICSGHTGARRSETLVGDLDVKLEQVESCGEATAELQLEAIADGLIVRGSVGASMKLRCNRCLTEFPFDAIAPITQAYGLPSEDDILEIDSDGAIDLTELLHDELSLAIPLVPLCMEACPGTLPYVRKRLE